MPKRKVRILRIRKIVCRGLQLLMQCKGLGRHPSETLLNYNAMWNCYLSPVIFARYLDIMCIFCVSERIFSCPDRAKKIAFPSESVCPFVESEVSVGLHAVKAQAAAMLCSSCPPSSPTYREQTPHLSPFRRRTGQKRHQKMPQCPHFAFWPRKYTLAVAFR